MAMLVQPEKAESGQSSGWQLNSMGQSNPSGWGNPSWEDPNWQDGP